MKSASLLNPNFPKVLHPLLVENPSNYWVEIHLSQILTTRLKSGDPAGDPARDPVILDLLVSIPRLAGLAI